jgi:glucosyl-3-phosphoglycerate synthase
MSAPETVGILHFDAADHTIEQVARLRGDRRITLCIPARNEAEHLAAVVSPAVAELVGSVIDEVLVIDDGSSDQTAAVATSHGARVVSVAEATLGREPGRGKGNALWASLLVTESEFVVWCDADVSTFRSDWVAALIGPMLVNDDLHLVKASQTRPEGSGGGGRTTELVARPLLSMFFPELTAIDQPLGGEYAVRRHAVEQVPFMMGWGVEIALLIDLAHRFGIDCLGQVDLGERRHRHHDLAALSVQAAEVMAAVLERVDGIDPDQLAPMMLRRPGEEAIALNLQRRPPLAGC